MLRVVALLLCFVSSGLLAQTSMEPVDHEIEVSLDPDSGAILIRDRVRVSNRASYRFRLAEWLDISEILLDGAAVKPRTLGNENVILLPGLAQHELQFELTGLVPLRVAGQTSAKTLQASSGSDGAYLPGYDAWIPQPDDSSIRYRLEVTVPAGQFAVASGRLMHEQTSTDGYRAGFEEYLALEPPALFVGPYQVAERLSRGLRLRTYFHAELAGFAEQYLDAAENYLQRYQTLIGTYPYADFHVISAPLPVGLGFPNLTYVGRQVIPLPFMRERSLAHEVLHNWWGNGVAVDYSLGNWSEGLTTYLADYALEQDKGAAAARSMRVKWLRDYAALPAARDTPVTAFTSRQHQASQVIGYNKVAFIFHMLKNEIGQKAVDRGLRLFWTRHLRTRASWTDLQAAFEQVSGRELGWFFGQWLQRAGAPQLSIGAHGVERREQDYLTRIEILQDADSYRFRLPLELVTETSTQRLEVDVRESPATIELVTVGKPVSVRLDPDSDIFRRLQHNETPPIIRDITLDPAAVTRIASPDEGFRDVARQLASRLMDTSPLFTGKNGSLPAGRSVLLITTGDQLASQLKPLGLQPPPALPEVLHTAAAWTAIDKDGAPVLVVSAANTEALQALLRPLPHYGGQSYVLFADGRAVGRGIWPVSSAVLFRDLSP